MNCSCVHRCADPRTAWRCRQRGPAPQPAPPPPSRTLCPSGCGFAVTWHPTHCCQACAIRQGHGPHCDRLWAAGKVTRREAVQLIQSMINPISWKHAIDRTLESARLAKANGATVERPRIRVSLAYPGLRRLNESPVREWRRRACPALPSTTIPTHVLRLARA